MTPKELNLLRKARLIAVIDACEEEVAQELRDFDERQKAIVGDDDDGNAYNTFGEHRYA